MNRKGRIEVLEHQNKEYKERYEHLCARIRARGILVTGLMMEGKNDKQYTYDNKFDRNVVSITEKEKP